MKNSKKHKHKHNVTKNKRVVKALHRQIHGRLSVPRVSSTVIIAFLICGTMATINVADMPLWALGQETADVAKYTTKTEQFVLLQYQAHMNVNATSSLLWSYGDRLALTVLIDPLFSDINGTIDVVTVDFDIYEKDKSEKFSTAAVAIPKEPLNASNYLNVTKAISTPDLDEFYILITIIASANVSGSFAPQAKYEHRFPDEDATISFIQVQRDNLAAILQLPGFPEEATFRAWITYYLAMLVIFFIPLLGVMYFRSKDYLLTRSARIKNNDRLHNEHGENIQAILQEQQENQKASTDSSQDADADINGQTHTNEDGDRGGAAN